ncbi:MAG: UDP-glucose dehydrogenase family protein [Enterobacteriaceae bacterium]
MKITVFGTGYVGLVQAAVLANIGHHVVCVDVDVARIEKLKQGIMPIYEPGLDTLLKDNLANGSLEFTIDAQEGVRHGQVQFIAVGTPPDEDGSADLSHVLKVAETIARYQEHPVVIVNKSTVPVGTADKVRAVVDSIQIELGRSLTFDVVSNPEFLKEGSAIQDCQRPDRIVIGCQDEGTRELMKELYEPFNRNHDRMLFMDVRSAELTKYAANSLLATKISFMNEMSGLAERLGADIEMVRQGIGSDVRIGYHFIYPGCGYGGSCFPKDVKAIIHTANQLDYDSQLLKAVEAVNERQKYKLFNLVSEHFAKQKLSLEGRVIAIWGLSFKPNTDDMREAPSRILMESLWQAGARVQAYDPEAIEEAQRLYGNGQRLALMGTKEAALVGADVLVICTDWSLFKAPDFEQIRSMLKYPVIFDGRNLFDPERMQRSGFTYYAIGRGETVQKVN